MLRPSEFARLCLILDRDVLPCSAEQALDQALSAGIRFFQYRSKKAPRRAVYEACLRLVPPVKRAGGLLIVNDYADVAAATGADGVHLGQEDLPIAQARKVVGEDKIIGISTHSLPEALEAAAAGADYVGFGPVFPTSTKDAGRPRGAEAVRALKQTVTIPIYAIGGIGPGNVRDVIRAGAHGVAVISAILSAGDRKKAAADMMQLILEAEKDSGGAG